MLYTWSGGILRAVDTGTVFTTRTGRKENTAAVMAANTAVTAVAIATTATDHAPCAPSPTCLFCVAPMARWPNSPLKRAGPRYQRPSGHVSPALLSAMNGPMSPRICYRRGGRRHPFAGMLAPLARCATTSISNTQ